MADFFDSAPPLDGAANPMHAGMNPTTRRFKNPGMKQHRGIAVREGLQILYRIVRDKSIFEALLFAVYLGVFMFVAFALWDGTEAFLQNSALQNAFVTQNIGDTFFFKQYTDLKQIGDVWDWMQGPVALGIYQNQWDNGQLYDTTQLGYVLMDYRVVGPVKLRQVRVSNVSCSERRYLMFTAKHGNETLGRFDNKDGTCWSEFGAFEDKRPYGPDGKWVWTPGQSELTGLSGYGPSSYGTGGYVVYLPTDRAAAFKALADLRQEGWIDRGTRALAVEFTVYNTMTKMAMTGRCMIEVYETAYINPWARFYSYRVSLYDAYLDQFRLVGELVYLGMWVYYLQKECFHIWWSNSKISYFFDFANLFEAFHIGVSCVTIIYWLRYVLSPVIKNFDVNTEKFADLFDTAQGFTDLYSLVGFLCVLYAFKVFRFLSISKKMASLWLTLGHASTDLISFGIGFLVINVGFAVWGHFSYAYAVPQYHDIPASFSTLMRLLLGDFDYPGQSNARPDMTPYFFGLYVALVFIVCLNMFIGIISNSFYQVHTDAKLADRWKISAKQWEADLIRTTHRTASRWLFNLKGMCGKKTPILDTEWDTEEEGNRREAAMVAAMHKCMQAAKRVRNIDLFDYLERLYEGDPDSDHLFVGIHELCMLTQEHPCPPTGHTSCTAAEFLNAYNEVKIVLMVGQCTQHVPLNLEVRSGQYTMFPVSKINRNGFTQSRLLAIDGKRSLLLNLDKNMHIMKHLPLQQLLQIEKSVTDVRSLALVFCSTGMEDTDERIMDLETTYEVRFENEFRREEFILETMAAFGKVMPKSARADDGTAVSSTPFGLLRAAVQEMQASEDQSLSEITVLRSMVAALHRQIVVLTNEATALTDSLSKPPSPVQTRKPSLPVTDGISRAPSPVPARKASVSTATPTRMTSTRISLKLDTKEI